MPMTRPAVAERGRDAEQITSYLGDMHLATRQAEIEADA